MLAVKANTVVFKKFEEQGCTRAADEVDATTPHVDNVYRCRHM